MTARAPFDPGELCWNTIIAHSVSCLAGAVYRSASYSRSPDGNYPAFYNIVPVSAFTYEITSELMTQTEHSVPLGTLMTQTEHSVPLGIFATEPEAVRACERFCREGVPAKILQGDAPQREAAS